MNLPASLSAREKLRQAVQRELECRKQRAEIEARCSSDPLYWLQNHTCTENPKHIEQGLPFRAPFPQKSYFAPLMEALLREKRLFIPKSREMLTSWLVMGYAAHKAQWRQGTLVLIQTEKEDKVKELVHYCSILYHNQEEWLKKKHPLATETTLELGWVNSARVIGIPKGEHQVRLHHPTLYIMDEVAFLPEAQACYDTAHPVAEQIIGVSSAGPGWFGTECEK